MRYRAHRKTQAVLEIGTARGVPGEYAYGALEAMLLPSGGTEVFPIIIGQGVGAGPVLWLTASIHGNEYTGIEVIHRLLAPDLPHRLRGAVVAVPTLNPAGLRIGERTPYYLRRQDPNRLFPTLPRRPQDPAPDFASPLELAYRRLFEHVQATADYLIDLHNYSLGSIPFAFRDPVYYRDEHDRPAAEKLWESTDAMLRAFGHTVINEFASSEYLKKNLHRSVSGAALHVAGIPAFTAELGGYLTVDPVIVSAAVSGIRNVMRWAEMLDDAPEPVQGIPVFSPGYPMRRVQHPHAPHSGIVRFLVGPGQCVNAGEPVARLSDIYGRPLGADDGLIFSDFDGLVLGLAQGIAFYQNDPLLNIAVRDDDAMILPYPA